MRSDGHLEMTLAIIALTLVLGPILFLSGRDHYRWHRAKRAIRQLPEIPESEVVPPTKG